jgi:plasmid stabilization system protein ParE
MRDLQDIRAYLAALPRKPALRIGRDLQKTLISIAGNPFLGAAQSDFTRFGGVEVRSRLVHSYRIFYTVGAGAPEVIAVLHTARDSASILAIRLQ